MAQKPLKRHKALQPFSREHHHGLLLSWKIRSGFNKNIEIDRIKAYTDWFFENQLLPHFEMEEEYIFPLLDADHELIKQALSEHERLKHLFTDNKNVEKNLHIIEEELEQHIRFEERILFPEIQKHASDEALNIIEDVHKEEGFQDNIEDEFWM